MGIPVAERAIPTVGVSAGLMLLLRVGGKRDLAQLNSFDLVVLLLFSNEVQNAVIGNDNSLSGTPTSLISGGQVDRGALRREGLLPGTW